MVELTPRAAAALKQILAQRGWSQAVRVVIASSGCCDAALGLRLEPAASDDVLCQSHGLNLALAKRAADLAGLVRIDLADGGEGFVITSAKPLGEWDGFGACQVLG